MRDDLDEPTPGDLLARGDAFLRVLAADEDTLPIAAFMGLAQEELREALQQREEAATRSEAAYRACDAADQRLDATIADLSLVALDLGGGQTSAPLFTRLFPEGPQAYTCAPLEEELRLVRLLRERLEGHPLRERFDQALATRTANVERTSATLTSALEEEARAWARLRRAEIAWLLRASLARATLARQFADGDELAAIDRILQLPESSVVAAQPR
jgi:hypothetical protein